MICIKKSKKPKNRFVISVIIITLFSIIFSMAGFLKVNKDNLEKNNEMIINNIYGTGKDLSQTVQDVIDQVYYEIKLYSLADGLSDMDEKKIMKQMNFITASKQRYDNIVVLNKEKKIVYGYVDNPDVFSNSEAINNALNTGQFQVETIFNDGEYKVDMYNPIVDENKKISGVIFIRINIKELNDIMKRCRLDEYSEAYIVNEKGMFLTESKYIPGAIGKEKIDIDRVKLNIDYSRYTPYKDYRGQIVYGTYFPIDEELNWTLVVEVDKNMMEKLDENNSKKATVLATLQGIFLVIVQILLKRFLGVDINLKDITNSDGTMNYEKLTEYADKILENKIEEGNKEKSEDEDKNNDKKSKE
ncbi:cache domain-containing protein [Clostridium senegalense]|uniref:cache domain-containing protein n=1 Tax=Clostridium senegalense TaxID=1465809 RepID=UPI001C113CFB|nr:cache domain-containing protein [Clostridium senegalense]MBU5226575.1 cache domain-containing protein [Clostridium senegalense]